MTVRLNLANGELKYQLFNLAQATQEGEALEYQQFLDKLRDGAEPPDADLGSDGEFYVDTDAAILYFKIGGEWTSIGGGSGGGGSDLTISNSDGSITTAATQLTFTGGVTVTGSGTDNEEVAIVIEENVDPTIESASVEAEDLVRLTVMPGGDTADIAAATTTTPGIMTSTDKDTLDNLVTYNLTVASGDTERLNPERLIFSDDGTSFFISTEDGGVHTYTCLLYTSPSPRDRQKSRMPSSA